MFKVCCDICRADLPAGDPTRPKHYCDRCEPFAKEFEIEVARLVSEGIEATSKSVNRYRSIFLQTKITQLKAVK